MKRPPTPRRRGDEGCGARIHFGHVAAQVIRMPALNSDEFDSIVRPKLERCEHPPRPVNTAKFAWTYFRTSGWQSAVASLIMAGILAGAVSRVPHPWGIWTGVTFTLTGLGALAFALAPWLYAIALAQAVHTGVLVRAEVVVAPGGGEELLVPSHQGAFRRPFNPKRSWQRLALGAHVLVLVDDTRHRVLVDFGPVDVSSRPGPGF